MASNWWKSSNGDYSWLAPVLDATMTFFAIKQNQKNQDKIVDMLTNPAGMDQLAELSDLQLEEFGIQSKERRDMFAMQMKTLRLQISNFEKQRREIDPIRGPYLNMLQQAITGRAGRSNNPLFTGPFNLGRKTIEGQYNVARGNILSTMPKGGVLQKALGDLEMTRAGRMSDLGTQINQDLIGQASKVSFAPQNVPGAPAMNPMSPVTAPGSLANMMTGSQGNLANVMSSYNTYQNELMMRMIGSFGDYYGYNK